MATNESRTKRGCDPTYDAPPKRRRGLSLGTFQGEIRVNELRYQAFVPPVFSPPTPEQRNADLEKINKSLVYSKDLYDDCSSTLTVFSDIPRLFPELKTPEAVQELRNRSTASIATKVEAAAYRPGTRIARGGRAGQELRELARAQQKATLAEELDRFVSTELKNYSPHVSTSGSYEFASIQKELRQYETVFVRLDAFAVDKRLFQIVKSEVHSIVSELMAVDNFLITEEDCWSHRPLIRHLIRKNLWKVLRPEDDPEDAQLACEVDELHRKFQTIEAKRWAYAVKSEIDSEESAPPETPPPKPGRGRKRAKAVPKLPEAEHESKEDNPEYLQLRDQIIDLNKSGRSFFELKDRVDSLNAQLNEVSEWFNDVRVLYHNHGSLENAEALFQKGLILLQNCDVGPKLDGLAADIAKCRKASIKIREALPELFGPIVKSIPVSSLAPWVTYCETLPFEVKESLPLTKFIKAAVSWREITTASAGVYDVTKCLDLVHKSLLVVELPDVFKVKSEAQVAQWIKTLDREHKLDKTYSINFLEKVLASLPDTEDVYERDCVQDALSRRQMLLEWIQLCLSPKFRAVLRTADALALERLGVTFSQLLPENAPEEFRCKAIERGAALKSEETDESPTKCTVEEFDSLCRRYLNLRVQLGCVKSLNSIRIRLNRWLDKTRKALNNEQTGTMPNLVTLIKEGQIMNTMFQVDHHMQQLNELSQTIAKWKEELSAFLKAFREAAAKADASRAMFPNQADAELANVKAVSTLASAESRAAALNALVAASNTLRESCDLSFPRPKFIEALRLWECLDKLPVNTDKDIRQLSNIIDMGEMWRSRAENLVKAAEKIDKLTFERYKLILLSELKVLAIDLELDDLLFNIPDSTFCAEVGDVPTFEQCTGQKVRGSRRSSIKKDLSGDDSRSDKTSHSGQTILSDQTTHSGGHSDQASQSGQTSQSQTTHSSQACQSDQTSHSGQTSQSQTTQSSESLQKEQISQSDQATTSPISHSQTGLMSTIDQAGANNNETDQLVKEE